MSIEAVQGVAGKAMQHIDATAEIRQQFERAQDIAAQRCFEPQEVSSAPSLMTLVRESTPNEKTLSCVQRERDQIERTTQQIEALHATETEVFTKAYAKELAVTRHDLSLEKVTQKLQPSDRIAYLELNEKQKASLTEVYIKELTDHRSRVEAALLDAQLETASPVAHDDSPVKKALSFLTESDKRLVEVAHEISNMTGRLTPERMLTFQVRLTFVQQELEFFSNALNKALEGTKTITNVQI